MKIKTLLVLSALFLNFFSNVNAGELFGLYIEDNVELFVEGNEFRLHAILYPLLLVEKEGKKFYEIEPNKHVRRTIPLDWIRIQTQDGSLRCLESGARIEVETSGKVIYFQLMDRRSFNSKCKELAYTQIIIEAYAKYENKRRIEEQMAQDAERKRIRDAELKRQFDFLNGLDQKTLASAKINPQLKSSL